MQILLFQNCTQWQLSTVYLMIFNYSAYFDKKLFFLFFIRIFNLSFFKNLWKQSNWQRRKEKQTIKKINYYIIINRFSKAIYIGRNYYIKKLLHPCLSEWGTNKLYGSVTHKSSHDLLNLYKMCWGQTTEKVYTFSMVRTIYRSNIKG